MATPPTNLNGSFTEHVRNLRSLIAAAKNRWELEVQGDENVASRHEKMERSIEPLRPEIEALCEAAIHELVVGTLASTVAAIDVHTRLGIFDNLSASTAKAQSTADIPEADRGASTNPSSNTQDQADQLPENNNQTPRIRDQTSRQPPITPAFTRRVDVLEQSMESLRQEVSEMRGDISEILALMRGVARVNNSASRGN